MRFRASIILPLVFLMMAITVIILGFQYPIRAAATPWVIAGIAAMLLIAQILREILAKGEPKLEERTQAAQEGTQAVSYSGQQYLKAGLWLLGLLIPIYLVGLVIGFPFYVFAYLKAHREGWILSLALAAATFVIMYFFFGELLKVYLYKGILLE